MSQIQDKEFREGQVDFSVDPRSTRRKGDEPVNKSLLLEEVRFG